MAFNKITFSTDVEKDLIPAWKDYVNHYRKENYSSKRVVNESKTLAEKENLVNKIAFSEIAKFANMDTSFVGKMQMLIEIDFNSDEAGISMHSVSLQANRH